MLLTTACWCRTSKPLMSSVTHENSMAQTPASPTKKKTQPLLSDIHACSTWQTCKRCTRNDTLPLVDNQHWQQQQHHMHAHAIQGIKVGHCTSQQQQKGGISSPRCVCQHATSCKHPNQPAQSLQQNRQLSQPPRSENAPFAAALSACIFSRQCHVAHLGSSKTGRPMRAFQRKCTAAWSAEHKTVASLD